jgi:hypothetical protein
MSSIQTEDKRAVEVAWTPPTTQTIPSGAAVAALIAAMLGMLALAIVNVFAEASEAFTGTVHGIGKLWMPGAAGIGPYSGKETVGLVVWIVSWAVLHPLARDKELNLARWLVVFLVGVGVATTLLWPPVYGFLAGH